MSSLGRMREVFHALRAAGVVESGGKKWGGGGGGSVQLVQVPSILETMVQGWQ